MYQLKQLPRSKNPNGSFSNGVIQTKLKIGQRGDKYEREADTVADRVMRMPEGDSIRMQPIEEEEEMMQMQPVEEEELLQPKPAHQSQAQVANTSIQSEINNSKGSGSPMDKQTLSFMGSRFGSDFSNVSIHNDDRSHKLNSQLNSRAFTVGNNIFFNKGNYRLGSSSGKKLLAHELTHVIQQGAALGPMVQRNGEEQARESSPETSGGGNGQFAGMIADVLRDQLSDSSMRGHLSSLGTALQGLAVESTTEGSDQPVASTERLAAIGIPSAFETTSRAIITDPAFAQFRQRLIGIVGSSDEAALIMALAAALALVLADISVSASPSHDLGAGFSVGGSFDLGTIRSLQFNNISAYAQFARDYFQTRLSGTVTRDEESGDFAGSGSGQFRIGNDLSHFLGRVTLDHEGQITLVGRLSGGTTFGGSDRLVFTTDITHSFASGETIIEPGVSGQFSFGSEQSIRLGSELEISSDSGLTGVTGFFEYRHDQVQLRIEGSMTGLAEESGIAPGGNMVFQAMLTVPF